MHFEERRFCAVRDDRDFCIFHRTPCGATVASEAGRGVKQRVESLTPAWEESSESHAAHLEHQQKLRDGVEKLTEALDQVRSKLATYREDAREIEVENVAIVN